MKKKRGIRGKIIAAVVSIGILMVIIVSFYNSRVYKKCVFEAGTSIEAKDFLKDASKEIVFAGDGNTIDNKVPGEYPVKLKSGIFTYQCTAVICDTIPPKAEAIDVFFEEGQVIEPQQFVTNVEDITEVKVEYVKEPDYGILGKQPVEIRLTDAGNNSITVQSNLIARITKKELEAEVGTEFPKMEQFLLSETEDAVFVTAPETIDMNKISECNIEIQIDDIIYTTVLRLKDTTAPVVKGRNYTAYINDTVTCENFIASATDVTNLTYEFVNEPNLKNLGEQTVTILVTDEGGNSVKTDVKLTVLEDTQPPVISGAKDFAVVLGNSISYKSGVKVTDNRDKNIKLNVDSSKVNTGAVGVYPVTYSAKDAAGNETSVTIQLHIVENLYSEENVNALADAVLAKIINAGMSPREKLTAIYNWVRGSIRYSNHSEKGDWLKAAYEGLADKKGDCYVYACTSKMLLNRAGIKNKDIEKIPAATRHYWNLVDIGEGWTHFDTTPRKGQKISFCYILDADLMAYSQANNNSHNYDRNVYTDIR